jgi:hypothetical protein
MILAILLAAALPSWPGCVPGQKPAVQPAKITITCADANFYVTGLRWSSWKAKGASGAGTATVNDCKPNCAAGKFHTYPVTIALAQPTSCHGRTVFTKLTWHFTRTKPTGQPRIGSITYGCL